MGAVAKRYARALFEVAKESQQLDAIEQELQLIEQVFHDNPDFLKLIKHPSVQQQAKKQEIKAIFGGKVSETMLRFLYILVDSDREEELDDIKSYYTGLANKERGLVDAVVTTVEPLSDEKAQALEQTFSELSNKKVRLQNVIDNRILGGIMVKIGDRIYDGSVKGKLVRFERKLMSTKS